MQPLTLHNQENAQMSPDPGSGDETRDSVSHAREAHDTKLYFNYLKEGSLSNHNSTQLNRKVDVFTQMTISNSDTVL